MISEDKNKKKRSYVRAPMSLLTSGLSPNDLVVWIYLENQPKDFNPRIDRMTKDLPLSKSSILRSLKVLEDVGLLKKETCWTNRYTVLGGLDDETWCQNETKILEKIRCQIETKSVSNRNQVGVKLKPSWCQNETKIGCSYIEGKTINKTVSKTENNTSEISVAKDDLEAGKMWKEYIENNHSKRYRIDAVEEAKSMHKLRASYGWDNSFLQELINFLIETKTDDKDNFSFFWYALHLKWFLSLTSDRSQRKAEMIQSHVAKHQSYKSQKDEYKDYWAGTFIRDDDSKGELINVTPPHKGLRCITTKKST